MELDMSCENRLFNTQFDGFLPVNTARISQFDEAEQTWQIWENAIEDFKLRAVRVSDWVQITF